MENQCRRTCPVELRDYGGAPLVVNIDEVSNVNQNFRTALWTGMQNTFPPGSRSTTQIQPSNVLFSISKVVAVPMTGPTTSLNGDRLRAT